MRIFITFLLATVIGATAYAVDFRLRDFNGDDFRIAQVKTELTLVFLYNSDCDACRKGAAQKVGYGQLSDDGKKAEGGERGNV